MTNLDPTIYVSLPARYLCMYDVIRQESDSHDFLPLLAYYMATDDFVILHTWLVNLFKVIVLEHYMILAELCIDIEVIGLQKR